MATTDHLQQRIRFFEISAEAKENIAKSESERIRLEIELNRLVNSEDAVTKSKAQKLKVYYEKLCEDESKSQRRNQQLLSDLKRIDSNFQELETKLERLTHVKKEMETYFKTAHPKWTTDNKLFEPVGFGMGSATFRGGAPRQETNYDEKTSSRTINSLMEALRPKKDSTHIMDNQSLNQAQSGPSSPSKHSHSTIASMVVLPSSNLPKSPPRAAARAGVEPEIPNKGSTPQSPQSRQFNVDREPVNQFVNNLVLSAAGAATDVRPGTSKDASDLLLQSGTMNQAESNLLKAYEQDIKRRDDDFNASSSLNHLMLASNEYNREVEPDNSNIRLASQLNMWKDDSNKTENINNGKKNMFRSPLRQELNVPGLFHLLDFVEQEISYAIRPENFYRQVEPHYKNKLEIIKLAREGKPLNQTDPADASMVVLDQLPIVIEKHTKNKCLFTRDLLGLSVADISEQLVLKSLRDESDKRLWKRLVKHWSTLVRGSNKLSAAMLARLFAVALIGQANAGASEKAVKFLEKIINEAGLEGSGPLTERSITETSINQELLLASSSKLKESSVYQDFIQNTQSSGKLKVTKNVEPEDDDDDDDDDDDENDDIDAMVAPKSLMSAGSAGKLKNQGQILKSPRANDYDFEFSQNSVTETSQKAPKVLHSLRSSGDKDKLPVHLRNLDSDDESETTTYEASARSKKSKGQKSDGDYDFYQ